METRDPNKEGFLSGVKEALHEAHDRLILFEDKIFKGVDGTVPERKMTLVFRLLGAAVGSVEKTVKSFLPEKFTKRDAASKGQEQAVVQKAEADKKTPVPESSSPVETSDSTKKADTPTKKLKTETIKKTEPVSPPPVTIKQDKSKAGE
ncbi:MAG: hypothetical protein HQM16_10175 [Deltaproteobacteria bacterium]|nr:hypothetical protein [Deltaproteobacteria bacterium]